MCEADAAIDALHADRVLLILVKSREDVQEFRFGHLWDQLDHVVENDGRLFAHLGSLIQGDLVVHLHQLLLVDGRDVRVHAGEELHGGEFGCEAVAVD